jgi:hypothetical protein
MSQRRKQLVLGFTTEIRRSPKEVAEFESH